jgi:hypothetical protein
MALDAQQAVLLVRVTARVSAAIFAVGLIAAARRAAMPDVPALRRTDIVLFAAFLASQTIHFGCVALLSVATGGENIRRAGGWPLVAASAVAFYAGAATVLRLKQRPGGWRRAVERRTETALLVVVWFVFFQAYALRFTASSLFATLAVLLAYSVAALLRAALRSQPTLFSP